MLNNYELYWSLTFKATKLYEIFVELAYTSYIAITFLKNTSDNNNKVVKLKDEEDYFHEIFRLLALSRLQQRLSNLQEAKVNFK